MPHPKYRTIINWKSRGLIYDDYDELYEIYIKTINCNHCNKEFKNSRDRCMDHDHNTGLFRKIVCQTCNCWDMYIKHPNGYDKKEYAKEYAKHYYEEHKEKIIQKSNQYHKDHKEERNEKMKQYYEENKEEQNKIKKQKTTCICGAVISNTNKSAHLKTERHLKNMDKYMENVD